MWCATILSPFKKKKIPTRWSWIPKNRVICCCLKAENNLWQGLQLITTKLIKNMFFFKFRLLGWWGCWQVGNKYIEVCKSAFSRIRMLTKLKHVGVSTEDLIEIYTLFICSRAEYVSVVWHSSLTVEQTRRIENIQKTSLKIILCQDYIDYPTALEWCGLTELFIRRQNLTKVPCSRGGTIPNFFRGRWF